MKNKISKKDALDLISKSNVPFINVFDHGTLKVEIYKPDRIDYKQPHKRDEVYIIISGSGEFVNGGQRTTFSQGDFLFVPAGVVHKFENFIVDFTTWVLFYGPEGGEKN